MRQSFAQIIACLQYFRPGDSVNNTMLLNAEIKISQSQHTCMYIYLPSMHFRIRILTGLFRVFYFDTSLYLQKCKCHHRRLNLAP